MKFFAAFIALFAVSVAGNPLYTWSLQDLFEAVTNPNTNPELRPILEYALEQLSNLINNGQWVDSIVVPSPMDIGLPTTPSTWTLNELSQTLQNPNVEPTVVPILENALDELMSSMIAGQNVNSVVVYLPTDVPVLIPTPVVPEPALPEVVPEPALPNSSPLVQIIVNVNNKQQQFTEIGSQEIKPTPVHVVDHFVPDEVAALLRQN